MIYRKITVFSIVAAFTCSVFAAKRPNIVLILADDMGIDSVAAFNDKLGLETPHLDRLVAGGMSFMDAHSSSAVCSPTRYGLLTGRYNWRSSLKSSIVGRWAPSLIDEKRLTLPAMLRKKGYATTMIGKWHLGHNWPKKGGGITTKLAEIDFTGSIKGGPVDRGFDYWFGDDVPNWPPYAWRENDRLLGKITTTSKALGLKGVSDGPAVADWKLEDVLPEYAARCSRYIRDQEKNEEPFFLYFPMPSPHTPIAPNEVWKGKSGISDYADFLLETDWAVGELMLALDESGHADDTLVIFTTDNGTSPKANFDDLKTKGVHLTEHWRGNKADAYDGGHRVPFIVRWPGQVEAGSHNDEIISLVDIMATLADVVGHDLPINAAEDSHSLLPILRGEKLDAPLHDAVICHSISGHFVVRQGKWKLLFCHGSGGWSSPRENVAIKQGLPPIQLYDLASDPKETTNLYQQHPEIISELTMVLRRYVENGRSNPGPVQPNHNGDKYWKQLPWEKPVTATGKKVAWGMIGTPESRKLSNHRILTISKRPADGRLLLPTPFPNIVRVWSEGADAQNLQFLNWTFNKDASEIRLQLPEDVTKIHLLTAEDSGRYPDGTIVLSALDSKIEGEKAKLETHPGNHRVGFWVNGADYVTWDVETGKSAGQFDVELIYSRSGKSGGEGVIKIDESSLPVKLDSTGSWYQYKVQPVGTITLSGATTHHVEVKSTVQKGAVMNLKAVLLHPRP